MIHQFVELFALDQRQIAGQIDDLARGAHRVTAGAESTVDLFRGAHNGVGIAAAHIALEPDVRRDDVDDVSAFGDDRVDPDMILIPEGLALGVDRHQPQHRRVERVDAVIGRGAGVGRLALVVDELDGEAVAHRGRARPETGSRDGAVLHDADVDIIKLAEANEFLLSAEEPELSLFPEFVAIGDLHILLGRNAHEDDVAVELLHQAGVVQRVGDRRDGSELRVVAAGVDGAGRRIGVGMVGHQDRVELTHDGDADIRVRALIRIDHAGVCDVRPRRAAEPARVDRRADHFFQFLLSFHAFHPVS